MLKEYSYVTFAVTYALGDYIDDLRLDFVGISVVSSDSENSSACLGDQR